MKADRSRILVVDDDSFVAEMLAEILAAEGYRVDTAEHGKAGLAMLEAHHDICLVISDMNMPEMDVLDFIEAVRNEGSQVPIIILTGNSAAGLHQVDLLS